MLLLVDGHRLNDNIYDSALIGTEGLLDVDLIERVEFIRGPASALYGDNAFLGVINITTRRGSSLNGAEASVEAGGFDTYKGRFSFGQKFTNDMELMVSGSWYDSGGASQIYFPEFNHPADNHGVAENSDGDNYQSLFGSLRWQELTLSAAFSRREKQVPTASYGTIFDSGLEETTDMRGYLDLRLEHEFTPSTRLIAQAYYDLYSYDGRYPYYATNTGLPLNPVYVAVNHDEGFGQWVVRNGRLRRRYLTGTRWWGAWNTAITWSSCSTAITRNRGSQTSGSTRPATT